MEVTTSLCVRLLIGVLFLLCEHIQRVDSVFLRVEPNKMQFFKYEPVTFHCEDKFNSTGLQITRRSKKVLPLCDIKTTEKSRVLTCNVSGLYQEDSGAYWCESVGGKMSNIIYISVTNKPVNLESPVLPVLEGDSVTLRCRTKNQTDRSADFYKDGRRVWSSSTGEMTISHVSMKDEGLYKCDISEVGESSESWLAVKDRPSSDLLFTAFRNILPVVMMTLLLLLLGFLSCGKLRGRL